MNEIQNELYNILKNSIQKCNAETIALSGGLDSTIIASFLQNKNTKAIAVISKDFVSTDLTYCQTVAQEFNIPLTIKSVSTEEFLSGIENTIRILNLKIQYRIFSIFYRNWLYNNFLHIVNYGK